MEQNDVHGSATPSVPVPTLLTVKEFWQAFGGQVGRNTIYELIRDERIKSIRLGERKWLIPASEVTDWPARELERGS